MTRYLKSVIMVMAGLCWVAFAVLICVSLYGYLAGGSGLQVFGFLFPASSTTVLVGLIYFVGFVAAACLSFVIGVVLLARGVTPPQEQGKERREEKDDA
ncbi:MAG: hypothetical protein AB1705_20935 [Verrucomicrobiota bacterium]